LASNEKHDRFTTSAIVFISDGSLGKVGDNPVVITFIATVVA
jgi:hypothetical protein